MMHEEGALAKIAQVFEQLRPSVLMDGGDIEFVKFEHGIVYVKMHGACVGCPASMYTLQLGFQEALQKQVPEVTQVVSVD